VEKAKKKSISAQVKLLADATGNEKSHIRRGGTPNVRQTRANAARNTARKAPKSLKKIYKESEIRQKDL
jgi:hypothetical protein